MLGDHDCEVSISKSTASEQIVALANEFRPRLSLPTPSIYGP